jgi:hypothetical protein
MHEHRSTNRTPRWVKATGIIVIGLVLLFGSLHLIGRSFHGHAFSGQGDHATPSSDTEHGMRQP